MKYLLDIQALQSRSRHRGIGRYSRCFAEAMLRHLPEDISFLINLALGDNIDEARAWLFNRTSRKRVHSFHGLSKIFGIEEQNHKRAEACEALYTAYIGSIGAGLVHTASPFDGLLDDTVVGWQTPPDAGPVRAVTAYDLIPFHFTQAYLEHPATRKWYYHRLSGLAKANLFLTPSEYTRKTILKTIRVQPERVVNISGDADPIFKKQDLSPSRRRLLLGRYGISRPFIMQTGLVEPHKNVDTLIQAFGLLTAELWSNYDLVLVGEISEPAIDRLRENARRCGINTEHLIFTGFVPDAELAELYGLSCGVVMPSLMEGFGLPLLEAMRCGAPVLGANTTSIPEVVGWSDLLFDPRRPMTLAKKISRLLMDEDFSKCAKIHSDKQQQLFSWSSTAARAAHAFADAMERWKPGRFSNAAKRRRYVLVPPCNAAEAASTLAAASEALPEAKPVRPMGPEVISQTQLNRTEPETISLKRDARTILLSSRTGLDQRQRSILASAPAVVCATGSTPITPVPEVIYRLGGYPALLNLNSQSFSVADLAAYPNVLGVVSLGKDLKSRIESIYRSHPIAAIPQLLGRAQALEQEDRLALAVAIAENQIPSPTKRLLVDISELVHRDARTGIQRVVRSFLKQLLTSPHPYRVEPIYRAAGGVYRYARAFTCQFLALPLLDLNDGVVDFYPSDTFLGLDLDATIPEPSVELLRRHSRRGMRVIFVIYDLLPLLRPEWFEDSLFALFSNWSALLGTLADTVVTISKSTADEFLLYLDQTRPRRTHSLVVSWCHLGSDVESSSPSSGITPAEAEVLERIKGRTTFLVVGTIEPRKGVEQLLDAAEQVWKQNDFTLVIVGKEGWKVDALLARIRHHPEVGRRFFRFERASDELVQRLYALAVALVVPSEGEGFGLPIVEAARHGVSIIARDLPVFREIAGTGAYYFQGKTGKDLARALTNWLELYRAGKAPSSTCIERLTWTQSARRLLDAIDGKVTYREWSAISDSRGHGLSRR